jgi:hypothetical protein
MLITCTPEETRNGERDDETRGVALIGMSLGIALLSMLKSKGIFTPSEVDRFLEHVLTTLEIPGTQ